MEAAHPRRAFLITGPESSGTKLWTQVFQSAGCLGGHGRDRQFAPEKDRLVVWTRSMPHALEWFSAWDWARSVTRLNYKVTLFATIRDWGCMTRSQVLHGHVGNTTHAELNIRRVYRDLLQECDITLTYEELIHAPDRTLRRLGDRLSLDFSNPPPIRDENAKHYA